MKPPTTVHFAVPAEVNAITVPLYYRFSSDAPLIQDRTGVLVRLADKYFVVTAEHDFFIRTEGFQCAASTHCKVFHEGDCPFTIVLDIVDFHADAAADVAVLEITQDTANLLLAGNKQFGELCTGQTLTNATFVLLGYPFYLANPNTDEDRRSCTRSPLMWFQTLLFNRSVQDGANEIKLAFTHNVNYPNGDPVDEEELKGMSGCGIWMQNFDETHNLRFYLMGIFNRYTSKDQVKDPDARYVRGATATCVDSIIRQHWSL